MRCPKCGKGMHKEKRKDKVKRVEVGRNGKYKTVTRDISYILYSCGGCGYTFTSG